MSHQNPFLKTIVQLFEDQPRVGKLICHEELEEKVDRLKKEPKLIRCSADFNPLPEMDLCPVQAASGSMEHVYVWDISALRASNFVDFKVDLGKEFRSGMAYAFEAVSNHILHDKSDPADVLTTNRAMLQAFDECDDYIEHLRKGRIKKFTRNS